MIDFISLAALARQLGMDRRLLLRQLQSLDPAVFGMAIRHGPGGKTRKGRIMVNRAVLALYAAESKALAERVSALEGWAQSLERRVESVEARTR